MKSMFPQGVSNHLHKFWWSGPHTPKNDKAHCATCTGTPLVHPLATTTNEGGHKFSKLCHQSMASQQPMTHFKQSFQKLFVLKETCVRIAIFSSCAGRFKISYIMFVWYWHAANWRKLPARVRNSINRANCKVASPIASIAPTHNHGMPPGNFVFCFLFPTHIRLCKETWGNKSGQFKICFRIPLHLFAWNPASKTILDHAYGIFLQIQKHDSSPWTPFLSFTLASTSLNPVSNQRNGVLPKIHRIDPSCGSPYPE